MSAKHAPHPLDSESALCGAVIMRRSDRDVVPTKPPIADAGDTVNCPDCRVVINYCQRRFGPRHVLVREG